MSFKVIEGDLLETKVEVIVNSANLFYSKGGGICKVIHDRAGHDFTKFCARLSPGKYCDVRVTHGFELPYDFVIHVITPKYQHDKEGEYLKIAVNNVLACAKEYGFKSIALPLLGAGHNGYPKDLSLRIIEECTRTTDLEVILVIKKD